MMIIRSNKSGNQYCQVFASFLTFAIPNTICFLSAILTGPNCRKCFAIKLIYFDVFQVPEDALRYKRSTVTHSPKYHPLSLHKGILKDLKYALVWGSSVKYQPQRVGKEHVLADEDIVQIIKKH